MDSTPNPSALRLTHIGEPLIAAMFKRSAAVRAVFSQRLDLNVDRCRAVTEAPLSRSGRFGFDGASRIDVALLDQAATPNSSRRRCVPCEAKLGTERMTERAFNARFLRECKTSHGDTRIRGSMPAILERKLEGVLDRELITTVAGEDFDVTSKWALVLREQIARKWVTHPPALSGRCTLVVFEELVEAYGGAKAFDALVRELTLFDYHDAWLT